MLSYVGGKFRQAKWISEKYPKTINEYAECFGGAMWVYINSDIQAKTAYYNDYNPFMANLFACIKEYNTFIPYLEKLEPQKEEIFNSFKNEVNEVIKNNTLQIPDFDIASKYVYIVTQCFSGIMSENVKMVDLKGKYKTKFLSFFDRLRKEKIQKKLDSLVVSNLSYDEFIPKIDNKDLYLYLDPPYYSTESLYAYHNFTINDHEKLANIIKECDCKWCLSYYDFPNLSVWFPKTKYNWIEKDYKKASMASKQKKQSIGTEILISNY